MTYTSAPVHYWGSVLDALACVFTYLQIRNTMKGEEVRYEEFPLQVNRAREAYYGFDPFPRIPFEMYGGEVDEFFHAMVMDRDRLRRCHNYALAAFTNESDPIPLRLL